MLKITKGKLLEDIHFRNFIKRESSIYFKRLNNKHLLKETHFIKIIALTQYGKIHDISLYAAITKGIKEISHLQEVMVHYPIIKKLSNEYMLNPKTVILSLLLSILLETPNSDIRKYEHTTKRG
ncbi:TPA: hypothetical protein ROX98_000690 [Bacillus pseudomycoides]|nr:hypothetical protein [Bacillus pseudomycoides]